MRQHVDTTADGEGWVDSQFSPTAKAMLDGVERYLAEARKVDQPSKKPPTSERRIKDGTRLDVASECSGTY